MIYEKTRFINISTCGASSVPLLTAFALIRRTFPFYIIGFKEYKVLIPPFGKIIIFLGILLRVSVPTAYSHNGFTDILIMRFAVQGSLSWFDLLQIVDTHRRHCVTNLRLRLLRSHGYRIIYPSGATQIR